MRKQELAQFQPISLARVSITSCHHLCSRDTDDPCLQSDQKRHIASAAFLAVERWTVSQLFSFFSSVTYLFLAILQCFAQFSVRTYVDPQVEFPQYLDHMSGQAIVALSQLYKICADPCFVWWFRRHLGFVWSCVVGFGLCYADGLLKISPTLHNRLLPCAKWIKIGLLVHATALTCRLIYYYLEVELHTSNLQPRPRI